MKRCIPLALVLLVLVVSGLIAGGQADKAATTDGSTVITFMTMDHPHSVMDMDVMTFRTMSEELSLTIDFELIPRSDYTTKVNTTIASKQFPDMMVATGVERYLGTGIFRVLDDLLETKAPNVLEQFDQAGESFQRNVKFSDGHYYFVPKIEGCSYNICGWINGNFLDELGLPMPTNTDELYTTLKAFKTQLPEDVLPLSKGPWYNLATHMYGMFGTSGSWIYMDGKYLYAPYQQSDRVKQAVTYLHRLYKEGILDREFMSRDNDTLLSLMAQDKIGYFASYTDNAVRWCDGGTENMNYRVVKPISAPGVRPFIHTPGNMSRETYIPSATDDAKVDKIMEMFNYVYGDKGVELFAWGLQGETFEMDSNGNKYFTDVIMNHELGPINGRRQLGMNPNPFPHVSLEAAWDAMMHPESVKMRDWNKVYWHGVPPKLVGTPEEESEFAQIMADVDKYVAESLAAFINGRMSIEAEFDGFVARMEKMGIERAIELKQAQLAEWKTR